MSHVIGYCARHYLTCIPTYGLLHLLFVYLSTCIVLVGGTFSDTVVQDIACHVCPADIILPYFDLPVAEDFFSSILLPQVKPVGVSFHDNQWHKVTVDRMSKEVRNDTMSGTSPTPLARYTKGRGKGCRQHATS